MSVTLNHTIVATRDPKATADFLVDMLGLEPWRQLSHFTIVQVGPTSLDLVESDKEIQPRHFAFLVSEAEFDQIFDGRGVYFEDPNGHFLEALTKSYGAEGCSAEQPHPLLNCGE